MDYARSAAYCLLSSDVHKYDPGGKQSAVTASPRRAVISRATAARSLPPSESLRGKVAAGTLRSGCTWCWGGREGGTEGWKKEREEEEEEERKRRYERNLFFFFSPRDKSCSLMGGARVLDLTKECTEGKGSVLFRSCSSGGSWNHWCIVKKWSLAVGPHSPRGGG